MIDICDMTSEELEDFLTEIGEKPFRGRQIFRWIYKGAVDFEDMSDLPADIRKKLSRQACIGTVREERVRISEKDGTRKYLFALDDGNTIETVLMKYSYGNSVCISSQAGCAMGCAFCASAEGGRKRDLTAGEMTGQIMGVCRESGEKVGHVVVMGTGEPFDNYENTAKAIRIINHKNGLGIGMRNITVSTCGIIPGIRRFAEDFPQVNLAVSLHAADDADRTRLMPVNKKYSVDQLLAVCRKYTQRTGRRITFEYALIRGVNDSSEQLDLLAGKLRGMLSHVNIILLNDVAGKSLRGSSREYVYKAAERLEKQGVPATVRRELGSDIDAACGQLRLRHMKISADSSSENEEI